MKLTELPAEKALTKAAIYTADIPIPPGGIEISTNEAQFMALFEVEFSSIQKITCELTFADDLWDPGEAWYIPEFGGQINQDTQSREDAVLNTLDCQTFFKFTTGRFPFHLRAENGSFKVMTMRFSVEGAARPF